MYEPIHYIQATIELRKNSSILYSFEPKPILIPRLHRNFEALCGNDEYGVCPPHSADQYSHDEQSHGFLLRTYLLQVHVAYQFLT